MDTQDTQHQNSATSHATQLETYRSSRQPHARMTRIRLEIELSYDADLMHGNEPEAIAWFRDEILKGDRGKLTLHSGEIGDDIGRVTVTELKS